MARKKKRVKENIEKIIEEEKNNVTSNTDAIADSLYDFVYSEIYSKMVNTYEPVYISTGVRTLDALLGGGFVTGMVSALTSPPETGKSTISLQVAARLLKEHPEAIVIYLDVENPPLINKSLNDYLVIKRLAQFGININDPKYRKRFIYLPGIKLLSKIYDVISEILKRKTETEKANNKEPVPALLIWDSLAESIPDEMYMYLKENKELIKQKGVKAYTLQEYLSAIVYECEQTNTGLILLDQVRANIQISPRGASSKTTVQHKDLKTATSAKAIEHKGRQWLFMEKGEEIIHKYPGIMGWILKISLDKSKLTPASGLTIEVVFDKLTGLNSFWSHYHFLSNRMPYENKLLNKTDVPAQIRKLYEESAPLPIQGNKIFHPKLPDIQYSFRSKADIYKKYLEDEEFREYFDKVLEISIKERIDSWLNPNSEFYSKMKELGIVKSSENNELINSTAEPDSDDNR